MPRRNSGARLRFLEKRGCYYIVWTEGGRSRERSTGTTDREHAEIALAEFINIRTRDAGPRDPAAILVTDVLADYAQEHGEQTAAPWRIAAAVKALVPFWQGRTVADVKGETCRAFTRRALDRPGPCGASWAFCELRSITHTKAAGSPASSPSICPIAPSRATDG